VAWWLISKHQNLSKAFRQEFGDILLAEHLKYDAEYEELRKRSRFS